MCLLYFFFSTFTHTHTRNRLTKRACVSAWLRAFLGGAALPTACDRRAANDRTPDASRIRFLAGGREDPQPERAHALLASRERRARASEVREGPAIQNSCGTLLRARGGILEAASGARGTSNHGGVVLVRVRLEAPQARAAVMLAIPLGVLPQPRGTLLSSRWPARDCET